MSRNIIKHEPFCSFDKTNFTTETCITDTWIKPYPYTVGITWASDTLPLLRTPTSPPPRLLHSVSALHVNHAHSYAWWGDADYLPPLQQAFGLCHRVSFRSLLVVILLPIFFSYSSVLPLHNVHSTVCSFFSTVTLIVYTSSQLTFWFDLLSSIYVLIPNKRARIVSICLYFLVYRSNISFILPRAHSHLGCTYHVYYATRLSWTCTYVGRFQ